LCQDDTNDFFSKQSIIETIENINTHISCLPKKTKIAVSVDCVIFGYDATELKVLLIDCDMPPYIGQQSLLGDLLQLDETTEEVARRIIVDRTMLTDLYLEQVGVYSKPNRHPLGQVVTISYYSIIKISDYEDQIKDRDNKRLTWQSVSEIESLAFDHLDILTDAYTRLQRTVREHPICFSMLPKKFNLIQLQNFYEIVLNIQLDRRNFRRKLMSLDLLIDLEEFQNNVPHRPAKLYSFNFKKYFNKKKNGTLNFDL